MIEARIGFGGYHYVIEASWMQRLANTYDYAAKIVSVHDSGGKDVTQQAPQGEEYGTTPGEAIDKVFTAARSAFGDKESN